MERRRRRPDECGRGRGRVSRVKSQSSKCHYRAATVLLQLSSVRRPASTVHRPASRGQPQSRRIMMNERQGGSRGARRWPPATRRLPEKLVAQEWRGRVQRCTRPSFPLALLRSSTRTTATPLLLFTSFRQRSILIFPHLDLVACPRGRTPWVMRLPPLMPHQAAIYNALGNVELSMTMATSTTRMRTTTTTTTTWTITTLMMKLQTGRRKPSGYAEPLLEVTWRTLIAAS